MADDPNDYFRQLEIEQNVLSARASALGHACHDERGSSPPEDVIQRASVYAKFLIAGK